MKLTKRKIIVIILAVILFIIFCPFAYLSPFKGKVIDADTKKPIEGAVVLVVYRREVLSIAGSNTYPADAQETLVDSNGEFKIPWRIRWFGKAKRWPEANVIIFKPGYGRFPGHERSEAVGENKSWPSPRKYIGYEIPELKTFRERKKILPLLPNTIEFLIRGGNYILRRLMKSSKISALAYIRFQ